MNSVASIVLAGGQGSRLFPLTQTRCKPSVCFGGRYRLIDIPISNSLNAHIESIFVISQYFASSLNQHILETYKLDDFRQLKIHLLCPEDTDLKKVWFKGTADAVRQNLKHLEQTNAEHFLILSGDQLYNMNFVEMIQFARKENADLLIASLPVQKEEAQRMGVLQVEGTSQVVDFFEKPTDPEILKRFALPTHLGSGNGVPSYLGSMGIYIFKRKALFELLQEAGDDFGRELIPKQLKKGKTSAYLYQGYWEDIGTIPSYFHANLALTRRERCLDTYNQLNPIFTHAQHLPSPFIKDTWIHDSIISQGSIIEAKEISHSILGLRVNVEAGTVIRDSIILGSLSEHVGENGKVRIGKDCLIQNAIIDEQASIGNGVKLINKERVREYQKDGIFIREGITVIPSGIKIPDGFVL